MKQMHICLTTDKNNLFAVSATMASVLVNSSDDYSLSFHVVHDGFIDSEIAAQCQRLQTLRNFSVDFILVRDQLPSIASSVKLYHHFSLANYFRIFLPSLLPDLDNIIYLDTDIIIRKNIFELWERFDEDFLLAAVTNPHLEEQKNKLGIPKRYGYFNSGMLLMNLAKMRNNNTEANLIKCIQQNGRHFTWVDQDALNSVLYDDWLPLPPKYNAMTPFFREDQKDLLEQFFTKEEIVEAREDPTILHYTGSSKPWQYMNRHPMKNEFWHYLQMTPWRNYKPVDYTWRNVLKKHTPLGIKQFYKEKIGNTNGGG